MEKSREELRKELYALLTVERSEIVLAAFGLGLDMAKVIREEAEREVAERRGDGEEQN